MNIILLSALWMNTADAKKNKGGDIGDDVSKKLWNDYRLANAYRYLLNGQSEVGQHKVADKIWNDFIDDFELGQLNHCVSLRGKDVSESVKEEVRRIEVANLDSDLGLEGMFALQERRKEGTKERTHLTCGSLGLHRFGHSRKLAFVPAVDFGAALPPTSWVNELIKNQAA